MSIPWKEGALICFVVVFLYASLKWTEVSEHEARKMQWIRDKSMQLNSQYSACLTHFSPEFTTVPDEFRAFQSGVARRDVSAVSMARGDMKRSLADAIQKTYSRPDRHAFRMACKDVLRSMQQITCVLNGTWDPVSVNPETRV